MVNGQEKLQLCKGELADKELLHKVQVVIE